MIISLKCQYALRAVFELTRVQGDGPIKISQIAAAQAIPLPFLQNILNQLKQAGIVVSVRGRDGGYRLVRDGGGLTIGKVISIVQGPLTFVDCFLPPIADQCPFTKNCAFWPLWEEARGALENIFQATTFNDLVKKDSKIRRTKTSRSSK
jgi:Rrf2 family transcriptional regulator, cysteine metabolism repressor